MRSDPSRRVQTRRVTLMRCPPRVSSSLPPDRDIRQGEGVGVGGIRRIGGRPPGATLRTGGGLDSRDDSLGDRDVRPPMESLLPGRRPKAATCSQDAPPQRVSHLQTRRTCESASSIDPETGVVPGVTRDRKVRSSRRCSMCPAIHITSRSWLRSSSTHEPSDPPLRVVQRFFLFLCAIVYTDRSRTEGTLKKIQRGGRRHAGGRLRSH